MNRDQVCLYAGVETCRPKFLCAVAAGADDSCTRVTLPTTTPGETLRRAVSFLKESKPFGGLAEWKWEPGRGWIWGGKELVSTLPGAPLKEYLRSFLS